MPQLRGIRSKPRPGGITAVKRDAATTALCSAAQHTTGAIGTTAEIPVFRREDERGDFRRSIMRTSLAKLFLALFLLSGAGAVLSACNTTAGAGEDLSSAGHAITNSADRNK